MQNTVDFLNAVKAKYGIASNYALARKLGQTDTAVARWMKGKNTLGDDNAKQVADLLDLDPAHVLACIHAEREKDDALKKIWERIARMTSVAAALLLVFGLVIMTNPADTANHLNHMLLLAGFSFDPAIHYAQSTWLEWAVFLVLFGGLLAVFPWHTPPKTNRDERRDN